MLDIKKKYMENTYDIKFYRYMLNIEMVSEKKICYTSRTLSTFVLFYFKFALQPTELVPFAQAVRLLIVFN